MASIIFQSRAGEHKIIGSDMLGGLDLVEEKLTDFITGDRIDLQLNVNTDKALALLAEPMEGISVDERPFTLENGPPEYQVTLEFMVVKRSHTVMRDWLNREKNSGFRQSWTTVFVEATTDAGEALFVELQQDFLSK